MAFHPPVCPHPDCPSRASDVRFTYCRRGAFRRSCDRRRVRRFQCLVCQRGFSEQSFRLDYRLKRPELLRRFFLDRVSKVTHRQSARSMCASHIGARCSAVPLG